MQNLLTPEDVSLIVNLLAQLAGWAALAVGLWLVAKLVPVVEKLLKTKLSAASVEKLQQYARLAASIVEEKTRKGLNGLIEDAPKTGTEKMQLAVPTARSLAPDGLATFTDSQIADVIEGQLPSMRPMFERSNSIRPSARPPGSSASGQSPSLPAIPPAPLVPSDIPTFVDVSEQETSPATPSAKKGAT